MFEKYNLPKKFAFLSSLCTPDNANRNTKRQMKNQRVIVLKINPKFSLSRNQQFVELSRIGNSRKKKKNFGNSKKKMQLNNLPLVGAPIVGLLSESIQTN